MSPSDPVRRQDSSASTDLSRAVRALTDDGPVAIPIRGRCMEPLLSDGDRPTVERQRHYWPGDVIVFPAGDEMRAHRLLGWVPIRQGWGAITRPDASLDAWDPPLSADQIVGRVTRDGAGSSISATLAERVVATCRLALVVVRRLSR